MKDKLKNYPGMVVVKKEVEKRVLRLREEIGDMEGRIFRAEKRSADNDRLSALREVKEERLRVTEQLLKRLEESTLEVEEALETIAPSLTPLEHIIIIKLYVEGLNWNQTIDELQTKPEYSRFCYERSSYMRAHRSALDKLMAYEAGKSE